MNTIEKHEICIKLIEAIQKYEKKIIRKRENINGFAGTFPKLRKEYKHNIVIYKMCIERLKQRYNNILLDICTTNVYSVSK